jgi:hypothetical protein
MLAKAPQFGCNTGDVECYCNAENFGNGIRDCANEACPSESDAQKVIAYGVEYCASE